MAYNPSSLFRNELINLALDRPQETKLFERTITDPKALDAANFFLDHGITREQYVEKLQRRKRLNFEDGVTSHVRLDEPPKNICDTKGLSPKRARYARFFEWRLRHAKELSTLESKKAHFKSLIDAPATTEAVIKTEIKRTANYLMGRETANGGDTAKRRALDERLASERHAADAAREALPELEGEIDVVRLKLTALNERESEFLYPAIVEVAQEIGLADLYIKKIAELREVLELVVGLSRVAGGWTSGFDTLKASVQGEVGMAIAKTVKLPEMPVWANDKEQPDFKIEAHGNSEVWEQLRQSLLLNPRHRPGIPLPK